MSNREYLGDSVYVELRSDQQAIELYLDNGYYKHTQIFLEGSTVRALLRFIDLHKENIGP